MAVIGAGPAGVMCGCTAAERGHSVTLYDRNRQAGGLLIPGTVPRIKFEAANYAVYLNNRVSSCVKKYKLKAEFGKNVNAAMLQSEKFDVVVIATGGVPVRPDTPGINLDHVYTAVEILNNRRLCDGVKNAVIIGGGSVGCETAHYIKAEVGVENVSVVEMKPVFMKGACTANRGYMIHYLESMGVRLLNCSGIKEIRKGSVIINRNVSGTVPDPYVTWTPLLPENIPNPFAKKIKVKNMEIEAAADIVILAAGWKPDRTLYEECLRRQVAPELYFTGDVFTTGRVFETTKGGYAIARRI